jgi:hypothetical protein
VAGLAVCTWIFTLFSMEGILDANDVLFILFVAACSVGHCGGRRKAFVVYAILMR